MSFRELTMIDVKELLRRWAAGHSDRKIARETGADRKTVGRYTEVATELALARDHELTDEEVHQVGQRVQARESPDRSEEWQEVAKHRAVIEGWLNRKRPLRLTKVHKLLVREHIEGDLRGLVPELKPHRVVEACLSGAHLGGGVIAAGDLVDRVRFSEDWYLPVPMGRLNGIRRGSSR